VAALEKIPPVTLGTLDPTLRIYSEQHLAVANTWAEHFKIPPAQHAAFLRHYLRSTSNTRCWSVVFEQDGAQNNHVLARFGDLLQYFDGRSIKACKCVSANRVPLFKPSPAAAEKLLSRMGYWREPPILTSFSKRAREIAQAMSSADLGKLSRGLDVRPIGRNNRYFGTRNRFYLSQIGGVLKNFCRHLDQELLHAIRSARCPAAELYNWLADGNRQRRLQALKAQPVLIPLLVMAESTPWPMDEFQGTKASPWTELNPTPPAHDDQDLLGTGYDILGVTADSGLPLNQVLAWMLEVPLSSIRFIGQQRPFHIGSALTHFEREGRATGWNAMLAGASTGNRRPLVKQQWKSFFTIWDKLPWQLTQRDIDLNRLFTGCPTDWADKAWTNIAARITDLRELFEHVSRYHVDDTTAAKKLLETFVLSSTYHQIGRLIDDFHLALIEIRNQLDTEFSFLLGSDERTTWPSLLINETKIDCPNGLQIVELKCPLDLWEEHCALGHCIDGYDYRAYLGACRLFSVRLNGQSLASAEVILERRTTAAPVGKWTPRNLTTVQLRGRGNIPPAITSQANKAYEWFLGRVRTGEIPSRLDWPDMTSSLARFANMGRQKRHSQAVAQWVIQRLTQA